MMLDESAHDLFLRSESAQGKGAYMSAIVTQRWREWTRALILLRRAGFTSAQIRSAIDALNPRWEMHSLSDSRAALAHLGEKRVLENEHIYALWSLSAEWWAGNGELRRILGPVDSAEKGGERHG